MGAGCHGSRRGPGPVSDVVVLGSGRCWGHQPQCFWITRLEMSFGHCLGSGLALPCPLSLSSVIWGAGLSKSPTSSAPSGAAGVRTQPLQAREGGGTSCQGSQGLGSTRRGCICSPSSVGPSGVPAPPPSCWEDRPLALLLSGAPGLPWVREACTGTSCPTHQFPQKKEENGKCQRRKVGGKNRKSLKKSIKEKRGNPL